MKKSIYITVIAFIYSTAAFNAKAGILDGPDTKITFHLLTEEGKDLQGIPFELGSLNPAPSGSKYTTVHGVSDYKGMLTLQIPNVFRRVSYGTQYGLQGYYGSGGEYQFTNTVAGKCQPWNPTVDVVVKPIINPIPMYAQAVRLTIPTNGTPVGYDLEAADWVTPYGKGSFSDFLFTEDVKIPFVNMNQPYDSVWTLSFSNKGDGIQSVKVPPNSNSALRLPRYAPEKVYQPTLVQEDSHQGTQWQSGQGGEDFFFRVRTVLNDQGNIKSALYGKIPGAIMCGTRRANILFTYYLNPTPNDRNMEFDPSKNLFQNLPNLQQVKAP